MKQRCIIIILTFFSIAGYTEQKWNYTDYTLNTTQNFRQNPLFKAGINFKNIDYRLLDAAIFYVTNEERLRFKLPEVVYAPELERSAWNHSRMMVRKNFFDHNNPFDKSRQSSQDRAKLAGISNPYIFENIADTFGIVYKQNTPIYPIDTQQGTFSYQHQGKLIPPHTYLSFADAVVKQWMNSPSHRANILSHDVIQLGCGAYFYHDKKFYNMPMFKVTQNFQGYKKIIKIEPKDSDPYFE